MSDEVIRVGLTVKKTWPVVEVFGPTIQGEGVDQGVKCHFVRFGGCDYRCTWCDTPHAVLPAEVRQAPKLEVDEIIGRLNALGEAPWVILSGGNPALHELGPLVSRLHSEGFLVAVETQGTRWKRWLAGVDRLCVSPKPPSSQEPKARLPEFRQRFLTEARTHWLARPRLGQDWMFVKVVIFNEDDLDFAVQIRSELHPSTKLYLSAGNDSGRTVGNPQRADPRNLDAVRRDLLTSSEWLASSVLEHPTLGQANVIVQSQYHVLLWGNKQGV